MASQMDFKSNFDDQLVNDLARRFAAVDPAFDAGRFRAAVGQLEPLKMKERVRAISNALKSTLPAEFPTAVKQLRQGFGPIAGLAPNPVSGFPVWVALQFVEDFGLHHHAESMAAMHELTQRFSAEFAIRPFLQQHPEATMAVLRQWLHDASDDVRRLVSEGTRPRLPWAGQLPAFIADPQPVLALLEPLLGDRSEYVRRSVANNLNDISKDHPDLVVAWLAKAASSQGASAHLKWIASHSCRSLIKAGHAGALALLGFSGAPKLTVRKFSATPAQIALGGEVQLQLEIESSGTGSQRLAIDYAIHFQKKRDTSRRVFKWAKRTLLSGEVIKIDRTHAIVPVSVRTYYPGEHMIEMLINGISVARTSFFLAEASADH